MPRAFFGTAKTIATYACSLGIRAPNRPCGIPSILLLGLLVLALIHAFPSPSGFAQEAPFMEGMVGATSPTANQTVAWGAGQWGQLGDGMVHGAPLYGASTPVTVTPLQNGHRAVAIAAGGDHSLALADDGTLWAWGFNGFGQLGNGNEFNRTTPVAVSSLAGGRKPIAMAGGYRHSLALADDGTLWAWGEGLFGQLGNGTTASNSTPVLVNALPSGRKAAAIAAGSFHNLALADDGSLWAWGYNGFGQLGDGTRINRPTPVAVNSLPGGRKPVAVAAGHQHTLVLADDATIWAWGYGQDGQLGNGLFSSSSTPVLVNALPGARTAARIAAGNHSLALADDGSLWAWGAGSEGELGDGTYRSNSPYGSSMPVQVVGIPAAKRVLSIGSGMQHSFALLSDLNESPVAKCKDLTMTAGADCTASASIDDGSFDPDSGDTITITQSPAGPYPAGHTTVTLTVTDQNGASSQCSAVVTVVDAAPPVVTLNGESMLTLDLHAGFTDPGATAADNCPEPPAVSSSGLVNADVPGTYTLLYSAEDPSGNTATVTRTVTVLNTGNEFIEVDPRGTFLHATASPAPWYHDGIVDYGQDFPESPRILDLAALGILPGDTLQISVFGKVSYYNGQPLQDPFAVIGLFSSSNVLLGQAELNRVPGAIAAGVDSPVSLNTLFGEEPTDIAQDFLIAPLNGYQIRVPAGARYLFLAVVESYWGDNSGALFLKLVQLNRTPIVAHPLGNLAGNYGEPFAASFPTNTFSDPNSDQTLSYSVSGLPPGISFNAQTRSLSGIPTAAGNFNATLTATDPYGATASASFDIQIARAQLEAVTFDATRVYGDPNPVFTGMVNGLKNGDNITVSGWSAAQTASVGAYGIIHILNDPSNKKDNYDISYLTGTLTVTRAPLLAITDNATRTYGDTNPVFTGRVEGLRNGDNITVAGGWSADPTRPVGAYAIIHILNDPGNKQANYNISYLTGTLTVTPAPLLAETFNATRVYGDPNPVFTGTINGLKNGDTMTVGGWSAAQTSPVGAYAIIHILNDPGNKQGNYNISYLTGTLTVTPAPLLVKSDDAIREYGEPNPQFTGTITGLKNGDNISATYWSASQSSSPGTYSIVPILSDPNNKRYNYDISYDQGTLIITPPPAPSGLAPSSALANSGGFNLTVTGANFKSATVVYWNGNPRPTTYVSSTELRAAIPASHLANITDIQTVNITAGRPGGVPSNPTIFTIVPATVGDVEVSLVPSGAIGTASSLATTASSPGVDVAVQNNGGAPITVVAATYDSKPVGETAFRIDNGNFVDVQITGADSGDVATVHFYYPANVTGKSEEKVKLRYFDGANWIVVLSSGGNQPLKDTTDTLDGTISGGRFSVIFDNTSTPRISELSGTILGMFNNAPQVWNVTGPGGPLVLGASAAISAQYAVLGSSSHAQISFLWGDGTQSNVSGANNSVSANKVYAAPGVYSLTIRVTDELGVGSEARFEYVVIYDPNGSFVTGGGWINSPVGAYSSNPTLTGKANFGFVSKYQKGATQPTGETEFEFNLANFNFQSTSYEWLVVAGARAQFKGSGNINGAGDYGFLLTATDGQVNGGGGVDKFRIKIWSKATGAVVYDNNMGIADDINNANPQTIGGGSIVIHK